MTRLHQKSAHLAFVAALLASSAAWSAPLAPTPDRDGVRVTQVRGDREQNWQADNQGRIEYRSQQMHTGGGGNSK